jgi:hypothetical protein
LQQVRDSNKILRLKALSEFLMDRGQQSHGLGRTAGRDPVRGKIGGDTQLEGQRTYCARFGERLLQPLFSTKRLTPWKRTDASTRCSSAAPAFSLALLIAVPGVNIAAERVAGAIVTSLFREDIDHMRRKVEAYNEPELAGPPSSFLNPSEAEARPRIGDIHATSAPPK